MKKLFIILALAFACIQLTAQPRAVGLRLNYGAEATYQHSLGEKNVLEVNAGLYAFAGLTANATYNWMFPIGAGDWNWYLGAGVGTSLSAGWFTLGAAGKAGIEYNFDIPLQLFFDVTPIIGPTFTGGDISFSGNHFLGAWGVGARYRF